MRACFYVANFVVTSPTLTIPITTTYNNNATIHGTVDGVDATVGAIYSNSSQPNILA